MPVLLGTCRYRHAPRPLLMAHRARRALFRERIRSSPHFHRDGRRCSTAKNGPQLSDGQIGCI
jgi:hypothetical protein